MAEFKDLVGKTLTEIKNNGYYSESVDFIQVGVDREW